MTAPVFYKLQVKAVEDLHTGAGTGSGDIDALVLRDRRGEPVIRASHLKGLLREAGDELVKLEKIKSQEIDALLGHDVFDRRPSENAVPRRGALRMTSLRVPMDKAAKVLVWGSSARELVADSRGRQIGSRRPMDDTLRYVEHVAAGTEFYAELRLGDPALSTLLEQLLRRIDRIGSDRNRGAGLVRVGWRPPQRTATATKTWEQNPPKGEGEVARLTRAGVIPRELGGDAASIIATEYKGGAAALPTKLRLVLRNLEPLCLPATGHPGNLIRSHSFIRGQTLRGALMAWAIARGKTLDVATVSVGNALPLPKGLDLATAVMPIPLSILTEKPGGASNKTDLPWWASKTEQRMSDYLGAARDTQQERPKRPGPHEYLCRSDGENTWLRYAPEMNVRLRNQTPKRNSGVDANLFSLEEIAEDTVFQADLFFEPGAADKFIDVFEPLLAGEDWLAIGRAGQPVQVEAAHWSMGETEVQFENDWTLTLTSDLVLRDEFLRFRSNLDIDSLCELVGVTKNSDWKIADDKFVESDAIHGFNAVSGLHRAPVVAIRRGSCWRITGSESAGLAKALWQKRFLGERTREGCGRIEIDVQPIKQDKLQRPQRVAAAAKSRLQEELLSRAKRLANGYDKDNGPSPSQLQWLRANALAVTTDDALERLITKIKNAPKDRPQGGKPWDKDNFPTDQLAAELERLDNIKEKQQLISHLVQWLAPEAKLQRRKRR